MKILAKSKKGKITAQKGSGVINISLDGYIGKWSDASVKTIKQALKDFAGATKKAHVYINSEGGSVFEANEMINVLKAQFDDIKVSIGALAASAATQFLVHFDAVAKKNTQIMIHKPMGCACGNEDTMKADLKLVENLTKQYRTGYATKMSMTEAELEAKWHNDWWLTADESLTLGLIAGIDDDEAPVDASIYNRMVACGAPQIPQNIEQTQKEVNMDLKLMAVTLGLPDTATEQDVQAKIKELQAKSQEVDALKAQIKAKEAATKKQSIKALLDQAEKDHKINAVMRASYEKLAEADFDQVKAIITNLPALNQAPSAQIKEGKEVTGRADWTYADYLEKDPEAFEQLPEDKQKALIDAYYAGNE